MVSKYLSGSNSLEEKVNIFKRDNIPSFGKKITFNYLIDNTTTEITGFMGYLDGPKRNILIYHHKPLIDSDSTTGLTYSYELDKISYLKPE